MGYSGRRFKDLPLATSPKRAGIVECEKCGKRIRPSVRKHPHEDGAECRAQQVVNDFNSRGWGQVINVTMGRLIEESGAPLEWALGACHVETVAADEFGKLKDVMVQHLVGFTPTGVLHAAAILARVPFTREFRRRAIKVLWEREDLLLAVDSTRRLGGKLSSVVHQCVVQAEEEGLGAPDR